MKSVLPRSLLILSAFIFSTACGRNNQTVGNADSLNNKYDLVFTDSKLASFLTNNKGKSRIHISSLLWEPFETFDSYSHPGGICDSYFFELPIKDLSFREGSDYSKFSAFTVEYDSDHKLVDITQQYIPNNQ